MSIPIRRQPEQEINAAWLEVSGLGMRSARIDAAVVARFLSRKAAFAGERDPRIGRGTIDATAALDRALAEAA